MPVTHQPLDHLVEILIVLQDNGPSTDEEIRAHSNKFPTPQNASWALIELRDEWHYIIDRSNPKKWELTTSGDESIRQILQSVGRPGRQ
jgi:hypothetical protein